LTEHLAKIDDAHFEILLVDDSRAEERALLSRWVAERANLAPRIEIHLIEGANRGKGHAARLGALRSRGDIVFLMDADLPVPLSYIEEFLGQLKDGACDVVIGERPKDRSAGKPLRQFLSHALLLLQQGIVFQGRRFEDTQCGFKAFRGEVLRSLATRQITDGGMYDIEYLYMALLDGCKVVRVPVAARPETRPSKIRLWKCMYTDPVALIRIKATGIAGGYHK
jgi:cellulose synthase/poly-beta-1,6-N-acetylglucosamine synthase-like glycosyltransferase